MTPEEIQEFHTLSEKRERNTMADEEYKRYLQLVDKSFSEGLPKVAETWMNGFGL